MPTHLYRAGRHVATLVAVAGLLGLAACGDDNGVTASTSESTAASTEAPTTTTPATTAPATTAPGTSAPASTAPATTAPATTTPTIPTDPEAYAAAFVAAWERGDFATASLLGTPDAVDTAFSREGGGPGTWSLVSCEGAAGSTYCTFSAGGDPKVIVRVGNQTASQGANGAVTEVSFEG